jgi:DNA polymerase-4
MSLSPAPADGAGLKWLYLDLNSYFASVEQQENPALRGKPTIVAPVKSEFTCAIAASQEAKQFGIRTGTLVREARQRCPDLRIVPARHDLYVQYHHRILAEIDRHIPVTMVCSIDEVACLLMGRERHPDNALALATAIQDGICRNVGECLTSSVGLAPSRLLAKIASDMKKPRGLVMIRADALPGPLLDLKLTDLPGIARNMERRLAQAGIPSVKAFWELSPARARAVWGSIEGERYWYALRGMDPPEIKTQHRSISHSQVLAPALRPPAQAQAVSRHLLTKAASRLRRMDRQATALSLSLRWANGARHHLEARFAPIADTLALLRVLDGLWRQVTGSHQAGQTTGLLKKVGVTLYHRDAESQQPDLFQAMAPDAESRQALRLSHAVDALNRKYGAAAVRYGPKPAVSDYTGAKIAFTRIPDLQDFIG